MEPTDQRSSQPIHQPPDYESRRDRAAAERDRLSRRAGRVSNLRLIAFLTGIAALVWAELQPEQAPLALGLLALSVIGFLALVIHHSRLVQRQQRAAEMVAVNEEALARLDRQWDGLPRVREEPPRGHGYARDLDMFGHASVARFFSTTGTGIGRQRLHTWLLGAAPLEEARQRQDAVRELGPMLDFRQDLQVAGRLAGEPEGRALDAFLEWAEDEPWLLHRPLLLWAARLIPLATLLLLVLHLEEVLARPWWIPTLLAGGVLAMAFGRRLHALLDRASLGDTSLRHLAELVERVQEATFEAPQLRKIQDALTRDCDARQELEKLGWITELADLRHGGLFYVVVHLPTLWDFHVLAALERWQTRAGRHAREWTEAIAALDALAALSAPPLDEPGWTLPDLVAEADGLEAEGLAHPLLPAGGRVPNDVTVGPAGTFLMVTGSNMSGKSTLLRSLGVNVVLAQAGGPVCAQRLRLPPLEVQSSMRVEDSLERGVSLFMAELQQLKRVVDAADAADERAEGPRLLYLLDEILHGTNSAERQVAVREVLGHLLRRSAIGAISTHDLELAAAEPLNQAVVPVHFRETVHPQGHEPPMTFDYRLREGIATSTNALKLVRLVGLT